LSSRTEPARRGEAVGRIVRRHPGRIEGLCPTRGACDRRECRGRKRARVDLRERGAAGIEPCGVFAFRTQERQLIRSPLFCRGNRFWAVHLQSRTGDLRKAPQGELWGGADPGRDGRHRVTEKKRASVAADSGPAGRAKAGEGLGSRRSFAEAERALRRERPRVLASIARLEAAKTISTETLSFESSIWRAVPGQIARTADLLSGKCLYCALRGVRSDRQRNQGVLRRFKQAPLRCRAGHTVAARCPARAVVVRTGGTGRVSTRDQDARATAEPRFSIRPGGARQSGR